MLDGLGWGLRTVQLFRLEAGYVGLRVLSLLEWLTRATLNQLLNPQHPQHPNPNTNQAPEAQYPPTLNRNPSHRQPSALQP